MGAHPRSRGENEVAVTRYFVMPGSSPLTRGKRRRIPGRTGRARLIPAHAGKTHVPAGCTVSGEAHPRSRGENFVSAFSSWLPQGSSPLTRGKHVNSELCPHGRGLIPAHAGKTQDRVRESRPCRAHPRSRGENNIRADLRVGPEGSSPLTRGKRLGRRALLLLLGLIPAHAGKTSCERASSRGFGAHPRSRGENSR